MLPCHVSTMTAPNWKRGQTGQAFVGRVAANSVKASVLAALLLPSTTQWGQSNRAPWPPDTWWQTHKTLDHRVCRHSTSPWTQEANMQSAWPWVRSQQNSIKSHPPQNIIMVCKMRRGKEDVCCISFGKYRLHVWSGFIRLLVGAMAQKASANVFGFSTSPKDGRFENVPQLCSYCHLAKVLGYSISN